MLVGMATLLPSVRRFHNAIKSCPNLCPVLGCLLCYFFVGYLEIVVRCHSANPVARCVTRAGSIMISYNPVYGRRSPPTSYQRSCF